jgi:NAD(P)H-flavin reductase
MDDVTLTEAPPPAAAVTPAAERPMRPRLCRIARVRKELSDTFTMELTPEDGKPMPFRPGQFNMLYVFGVGEVPISISGDPTKPGRVTHTTRVVGKVTEGIGALKAGDVVGVRGPYGTHWPVEAAEGADIVFVAGGIGLAPLRPAILQVMADRGRYGNVAIFYGARTPEDILYRKEVQTWRSRFDVNAHVTVDRATGKWNGKVGVVTQLIKSGGFDRHSAVAYVCGPEVMMRYAVETLEERGVTTDRIYVSMERNMKCGIGLCGHCQVGPVMVCRDGPVFRFDRIADIFTIWEL